MSSVEKSALGEFRQYWLWASDWTVKGYSLELELVSELPKICEQFDIFFRLTKSRDVFPPDLLPRKKDLRKSLPASSQSPYYCWFARDVKAAMLDEKNKSISFLWELNSIFM